METVKSINFEYYYPWKKTIELAVYNSLISLCPLAAFLLNEIKKKTCEEEELKKNDKIRSDTLLKIVLKEIVSQCYFLFVNKSSSSDNLIAFLFITNKML